MLSKLCCLSPESCKGQCLGLSRNQNIKLAYLIIIILVMTLSFIITNSINHNPHDQTVQQYQCSDIQPDYQWQCISQKQTTLNFFALAVFHFVLFLSLLPKTKHVKVVNQGLWIIKLIIIAVLIVVVICTTVGSSISSLMEYISITLSPVLFIITNIIIIDNIYFLDFKINGICEKYNKMNLVKVGLAIVMWLGAIALNVISYYNSELWVSVGTSVAIGLLLVVTLLRVSKNNSLFVYALAVLHLTLISYSIHTQHPHYINIFLNLQHPYRIFILITTLFCMLTQGGNQIRTKNSTLNEILALNTSKREEDNRYVSSNKWIIYHLMMILIVFTIPIILVYDYEATTTSSRVLIDVGKIVWWGSAIIIYLWSVIVQKIYPEQDFSELQNYFKEFQLN